MHKLLILTFILVPLAGAQTALPAPIVVAASTVEWYPIGDVNGDGLSDGMIWISTPATDLAIVAAGPDMEDVIWSSKAIVGSPRAYDMIDHTGDGVVDLVTRAAFHKSGGAGQQCVEVACQYEYESHWTEEFSLYDGTDGESKGYFRVEEPRTDAGGRLSAPVAYLDARKADDTWAWVRMAGPGQYWAEATVESGVRLSVSTPAGGEYVRESLAAREFTYSTFTGESTTKTFDGITDYAGFEAAFADVNGDGKSDMIIDHGVPVYIPDMGVIRPVLELTAYSATDASEIWSTDLPTGQLDGFSLSFGDLNDDGVDDIQHLGLQTDGMTWAAFSGKDGSSLGSAKTGTNLEAAIPWQDVDGDGKSELLFLVIAEGDEEEQFGMELRMQGGTVVWTLAPNSEFPISLEESLEGGRGITDLTGDGISDLVFSTFDSDATYWGGKGIKLVDGATGETIYDIATSGSFWHMTISDLTGDGLDDIVSLIPLSANGKAVDSNAAGMRLEVRRGTDGELAWTRIVMDKELKGARSVDGLNGMMSRAGDVDGDGREDITVKIEAGNWWMLSDPNNVPSNPVDQSYVISGSSGKILWMAPTLSANGTLVSYTQEELAKLVESPPSAGGKLPAAQPAQTISQQTTGDAYAPTDGPDFENQPSKDSPGAAVSLIVLAVALLAARRRV